MDRAPTLPGLMLRGASPNERQPPSSLRSWEPCQLPMGRAACHPEATVPVQPWAWSRPCTEPLHQDLPFQLHNTVRAVAIYKHLTAHRAIGNQGRLLPLLPKPTTLGTMGHGVTHHPTATRQCASVSSQAAHTACAQRPDGAGTLEGLGQHHAPEQRLADGSSPAPAVEK